MVLTEENIKKDQDYPEHNSGYHQEVDSGRKNIPGSTLLPWIPARGSPQGNHGQKDSGSSEEGPDEK